MATTELAVVGAGPAGLAAAVTAARVGVHVTLIDEYPAPGGQYLKGADTAPPASATERRGQALRRDLSRLNVDLRLETLVWGIEGLRLALHTSGGGVEWLEAKAVVIAAGARELVLPFPGWTLPGVMTAGAVQLLAKGYGIRPGQRVLLAGSGPLLLAAAYGLVKHRAEVVAVLEATHPRDWLRYGPAVWGHWERLAEGWRYLSGLRRARIPYHFGRTVIRAMAGAGGQLEAVVIARLDRQGRPISGSEETVAVDMVGLNFGFVPNVELTQLAGCAHESAPTQGGWVPSVNEQMESSIPHLFVAGESAGITGAGAAMIEGWVAGLTAAQRLGYVGEAALTRELAALTNSRRRLQRFGAMLNTLFAPRPGLDMLVTDETIICRCEEVTTGEVRAAVAQGITHLDALKNWTRVGQGPCQGRVCGPLLARLIARQTGCAITEAGFFRVRPPLKPVPLGDLARGAPTEG